MLQQPMPTRIHSEEDLHLEEVLLHHRAVSLQVQLPLREPACLEEEVQELEHSQQVEVQWELKGLPAQLNQQIMHLEARLPLGLRQHLVVLLHLDLRLLLDQLLGPELLEEEPLLERLQQRGDQLSDHRDLLPSEEEVLRNRRRRLDR